MANKPYNTGLFMGGLRIIHKGHQEIIDLGLELCDKMLIVVGSAQEKETFRNPFCIETRMKMVKVLYPDDNVIVRPLDDLTSEDDITYEWGDYLLDNVNRFIGKDPDLMLYGNDESRSQWFRPGRIDRICQIIISRTDMSATHHRYLMQQNDEDRWRMCHDERLYPYYQELREELMQCYAYR